MQELPRQIGKVLFEKLPPGERLELYSVLLHQIRWSSLSREDAQKLAQVTALLERLSGRLGSFEWHEL